MSVGVDHYTPHTPTENLFISYPRVRRGYTMGIYQLGAFD